MWDIDLTEEERAIILTAPEFADFVESSTKIIQRALNDNYDYIRDYTLGAESGVDDSEGKRVKRVCAFFDERYGKNRSITAVDWSPKVRVLYVPLRDCGQNRSVVCRRFSTLRSVARHTIRTRQR